MRQEELTVSEAEAEVRRQGIVPLVAAACLLGIRDAAGQATSVMRLGSRAKPAAMEMDALFRELLGDRLEELLKSRNPDHGDT